jgi:hypothetical protein
LRRILAVPARELTGEIAAANARITEQNREEAGLVRPAARLEEGDDAAESLLAQLRETVQRRKAVIESLERLESEALDTEARAGRIEATIAAVEGVGGATALDDHGKRQAPADLSVKVVVDPEWHESNYRWLMWAFERRDDGSCGRACRESGVRSSLKRSTATRSTGSRPLHHRLARCLTDHLEPKLAVEVGRIAPRVEHPAHVLNVRMVEHRLHQPATETSSTVRGLDVDI